MLKSTLFRKKCRKNTFRKSGSAVGADNASVAKIYRKKWYNLTIH